jgi:hypothetical protein
MMKKVLIGCGGLVFVFVALIVAYGAWQWWSNDRATTAATAFCDGVQVGDTVASVEAAAARNPARHQVGTGSDGMRVTFSGGMFFAADCVLGVEDGKVTTVEFVVMDD